MSVVDDAALLFESSLDLSLTGEDLVECPADFADHGQGGFLAWLGPVGLSFSQDKLVLTMEEESGSIWILDNID